MNLTLRFPHKSPSQIKSLAPAWLESSARMAQSSRRRNRRGLQTHARQRSGKTRVRVQFFKDELGLCFLAMAGRVSELKTVFLTPGTRRSDGFE